MEKVKTKTGNAGAVSKRGRPCKYASVAQIQRKINAYFRKCDQSKKVYTVCGLALALNLSRQGLCEYEHKLEFSDTIKKAKTRIEARIEENMLMGVGNVTGAIFNLKNNFGWKNEQHIKSESEVKVTNDTDDVKLSELPVGERVKRVREWLNEHRICSEN